MPVQDSEERQSLTLSDFSEQGAVVENLIQALGSGSFAHAHLVTGQSGVGKRSLSRLLTQGLLCTAANKPCSVCPACKKVAADSHPDVLTLRPGEPVGDDTKTGRKLIPISDIRKVNELCMQRTMEGGRRVILIEQADTMTPQAQNALLKTLEEPPAGVMFLLMTDAPSLLLPTIISRCRQVMLHPWSDRKIMTVLKSHGVADDRCAVTVPLAGGSIGKALTLAADDGYWQRRQAVLHDFFGETDFSSIIRVSTDRKDRKEQSEELFEDVESILRTMMLCSIRHEEPAGLDGIAEKWIRKIRTAGIADWMRLFDALREARKQRASQVTWQAVLERLLFTFRRECP